jgi:hypothetical protein
MATQVYLERGTKRIFAVAVDWPGWARSVPVRARDRMPDAPVEQAEEAALEALAGYLPRYAQVAAAAGLSLPADAADDFVVVERLEGDMTTDFGAPSRVPTADHEAPPAGRRAEGERLAALLGAAWDLLDGIAATAPSELRKGPRGGGRDRDGVVEHVVNAEASYVRSLGMSAGVRVAVQQWRSTLLAQLREEAPTTSASNPRPAKWPVRYAVRRISWHVLDHAWEIEDRST